MDDLIVGVFSTILLVPGFISIFIPYWIIGRKFRYSTFELTLISLALSLGIIFGTFIIYQFLNYLGLELFKVKIQISNVTVPQLFDNNGFLFLFSLLWIATLLVCLFIIPQDRLGPLRKWLRKRPPAKLIWDEIRDDEEHKGFAVVETNDQKFIVGFLKRYSIENGITEIILKYPERYNIDKPECTPIPNVEYILFKDEDIKRIYFMSKTDI